MNTKTVLLIISEKIFSSASNNSSSTVGLINPGARVIISCITALLTSIAVLITNEFIPELNLRYTILGDCFIVTNLFYEKSLKKNFYG